MAVELQKIRQWMENHPFNLWMGMEVGEISDQRVVIHLPIQEHHRYISGLLHGGLTAALLDSVIGVAARISQPEHLAVRTTNLTVTYLGPARGDIVTAEGWVAEPELAGALVGCGQVRDGDDVVAEGHAAFATVIRRRYRTSPQRGTSVNRCKRS